MSWVKRVEVVMDALKGSSIGEIELAEGGFEIIIRRNPGCIVTTQATQHHTNEPFQDSRVIEMKSPLTGIYYAAPSPEAASFINVGDIVKVGQSIALIEAMKVFNEIQSEVAGRVVEIKVKNGILVKKNDVLFRVEPQ
jgi:acetyl-CoA carboxylase biotin carboxyl carrier protein